MADSRTDQIEQDSDWTARTALRISHQSAAQHFNVAAKLKPEGNSHSGVTRQHLDRAAGAAGYVHEDSGELVVFKSADPGRIPAAFVLEINQLLRAPIRQPSANGVRDGFTHCPTPLCPRG